MNESSPLLSIETQSPDDVPQKGQRSELEKNCGSSANVLVAAVCGLFYMTNFVNIGLLADRLDTTSVKLGSVFIGEAVAAVIGGLFWPNVSHTIGAKNAILFSLIGLLVICFLIMLSTSTILMYFLYFFAGLLTSFLDTGSAAIVRVIHQGDVSAGPWLTGLALTFLLGGMFAVLLNGVLSSVSEIYAIVAFFIVCVTAFNWYHQDSRTEPPPTAVDKIVWNTYIVEIIMGLTMGLIDGSATSITSYMETYVEDTGVVSENLESYVVFVFWSAMLVAEVVVLTTQRNQSTETLLMMQGVSCVVAIVALTFVVIYPSSGTYLWIAMAILGLCNATGFCVLMDVANRICRPTALSGTIIFFGISLGISGLPYVVSAVWDYSSAGPSFLIYLLIGLQVLMLVAQLAPQFRYVEI